MDALQRLAERYLQPVFEILVRHQDSMPWIFYGWIVILLAISLWRWRQQSARSRAKRQPRIVAMEHTSTAVTRSNWGAMLGLVIFLLGCLPFMVRFPFHSGVVTVVAITMLIVIIIWVRTRTISWLLILFTIVFLFGAHHLSGQISRQAPWTHRQEFWLLLMGSGLGLMMISMAAAALVRRRSWVVVRARCIDREVMHTYTPGPEPGRTWTFQLLCEFRFGGKTYRVTPAYWRTFATEAGVNRFLSRQVTPAGKCQLRINPANPLQAEMGPAIKGGEGGFPVGRVFKLAGLAGVVVGAVFLYDGYANHSSRWEVIPNPMVRLAAVEASEFKPSWTAGYAFAPLEKKRLDDGRIQLLYTGRIANPTLSLTLKGVDYESCRKQENHWVVTERASGRPKKIACPRVTLENAQPTPFATHFPQVYPSYPSKKNRQPDGRVILAAGVIVDNAPFGLLLPADTDFASIEIRDGHFRVRKKG